MIKNINDTKFNTDRQVTILEELKKYFKADKVYLEKKDQLNYLDFSLRGHDLLSNRTKPDYLEK